MLPSGKLIVSYADDVILWNYYDPNVSGGYMMNLINQNNLNVYTKVYTGTFFNTNYKDGWSLTIDRDIKYFSATQSTSGSPTITAWVISCGTRVLLKYDITAHTFVPPSTSFSIPKSTISGKTVTIDKE